MVTLGAVKNPLLEMVPALDDQVTAVFGVPLMRAVNCSWSSDAIVALTGVSESAVEEELVEEGLAALCEVVPHAVVRPIKSARTIKCGIRELSP